MIHVDLAPSDVQTPHREAMQRMETALNSLDTKLWEMIENHIAHPSATSKSQVLGAVYHSGTGLEAKIELDQGGACVTLSLGGISVLIGKVWQWEPHYKYVVVRVAENVSSSMLANEQQPNWDRPMYQWVQEVLNNMMSHI